MLEMMLQRIGNTIPLPAMFTKISAINPPPGRSNIVMAGMDEFIYALGGNDHASSVRLSRFDRFSTLTNTWQALKPYPVTVSNPSMVALGGKIYVYGGLITASTAYGGDFYCYDPNKDTWTSLTPPADGTVGKVSCVMFTYGRNIYVLGGSVPPPTYQVQTMVSFNIDTGVWSNKASYGNALTDASSTWVGDYCYVGLGTYANGASQNSKIKLYNPINNTWTLAVQGLAGTNRYGCAEAVFGKTIYYIGSRQPTIETFDTTSGTFTYTTSKYPNMINSYQARSAKVGETNYIIDWANPEPIVYKWG